MNSDGMPVLQLVYVALSSALVVCLLLWLWVSEREARPREKRRENEQQLHRRMDGAPEG